MNDVTVDLKIDELMNWWIHVLMNLGVDEWLNFWYLNWRYDEYIDEFEGLVG